MTVKSQFKVNFESYYDNLFRGASAAVEQNLNSLVQEGELQLEKLVADECFELHKHINAEARAFFDSNAVNGDHNNRGEEVDNDEDKDEFAKIFAKDTDHRGKWQL